MYESRELIDVCGAQREELKHPGYLHSACPLSSLAVRGGILGPPVDAGIREGVVAAFLWKVVFVTGIVDMAKPIESHCPEVLVVKRHRNPGTATLARHSHRRWRPDEHFPAIASCSHQHRRIDVGDRVAVELLVEMDPKDEGARRHHFKSCR